MIISLFYLIVGAFLNSVAFVFGQLNYSPPVASLFSGVDYFISFTRYFGGILDLPAVFTAAGVALTFEFFWFLFLIAWYVVGFFRSIITWGSTH